MEGYVDTVENLGKVATSLIQKDHFDSSNINARKVSYISTFVLIINCSVSIV